MMITRAGRLLVLRGRPRRSSVRHQRRRIVSQAVTGLKAVHDLGLPWVGAISVTTIAVRLMLVPVTLISRSANRRLLAAAPELRELTGLWMAASRRNDIAGRQDAVRYFLRAVDGTLRKHNANPLTAFLLMPAIHIPTFVTFALAVRDLSRFPDYASGGPFWFTDLASADPTGILPFFALAGSYGNLHGVGGNDHKLTIPVVLRHAAQLSLIVAFPVTLQLPAGFLVYWITSTGFTFVSTRVFFSSSRTTSGENVSSKPENEPKSSSKPPSYLSERTKNKG